MNGMAPLGPEVDARVGAGRPSLMSVSVVICAYTMDRWDALAAAVGSCFDQTHKPSDVVVVIDYNEDLLQRATQEFTGAVVVANRFEKGLSAARNTGIAASRGDVIAFLDDDAFAEPEWLEQLIAPFGRSLGRRRRRLGRPPLGGRTRTLAPRDLLLDHRL